MEQVLGMYFVKVFLVRSHRGRAEPTTYAFCSGGNESAGPGDGGSVRQEPWALGMASGLVSGSIMVFYN